MATTPTTPTNVATSIPRKYASRVMRDMKTKTFWDNLSSLPAGGGALISQTELLNKPGETVYIQVTAPLSGAGISGDTTVLEGNEEALSTTEISVTPIYRRHGVRLYRRAQKKSAIDLREEARMRLSEWGRDQLDTLRFTTLTHETNGAGSGAFQHRIIGGGGNVNALTASNVLTLAEVSKSKYILNKAGGKPFNIGGNDFYVFVVDDWQEYSLKVTDTTYAQAQREAGIRGSENPLFQGSAALWDGVIIRKANRVPAANNTNSPVVRVANALLFGQEAFVEAFGENSTWVEKTFDYDNEWGVAYGYDYACKRGFECRSMQISSAAVAQT